MKTKHIKALFYCLLIVSGGNLFSQDIHFSQYAETPSSINPALAGVSYNTRAVANYKSQWSTVASKYMTMGFSFEQTIKHKKLKGNYFAVATNVFKEVSGDARLSKLNPNLGINYVQVVAKGMKLSAGIQGGFIYQTIDASVFKFDRQFNGFMYDASLPTGEGSIPRSSITAFDMGGGLNFNFIQRQKFISSKSPIRFDVGVSAYHFGLGKSSFLTTSEKLSTRYCGYFNGEFNIPSSINSIMPSFLFMKQSGNMEFITGALFKFNLGDPSTYTGNKKQRCFSVGSYYRFKDAIIPSMLINYNTFAFGFSYDINISNLTPASRRNGGIEIMVKYNVAHGYGVNLGRNDTKPSY